MAAVSFVAEFEVRLDGVAAVVLEFVGAELVHEADAATFLLLVEEDSGSGFGDHGHGEFELLAAVAAERVEDVSGEALGMDADDGRSGGNVAHDEGNGRLDSLRGGWSCVVPWAGIRQDAFKAEDAELTPTGGKVGIGELAN